MNDGWTDGSDFIPHEYVFTGSGGVTPDFQLDPNANEADYFRLFLDDEVVQVMADETNRYHYQRTANRPPSASKMKKWFDVCLREMFVFLAITLLMPHTEKHRVRDYWSTDAFLRTPIYGHYMARDQYQGLHSFFHVTDNTLRDVSSNDRLWKIRNVMEMIRERLRKYFYPFQNW